MSTAQSTLPREIELARMEAVRRYDILDTPRDGSFDRITHLAARICDVPISTITIVDEDRIWFKSAFGLEVDQIGREPGLCASAIIAEDIYMVSDARIDPRTLNNPLVRGELGLQFYVGIPLRTADGHSLGTLNVIDQKPRELDEDQIASLRDLAAIVMDELELRLAARAAVALEAAREAAEFRDAIVAGITHEMRTPLAVLKGVASLEDAAAAYTEEEAAQMRALRRRHLDHLEWLVQQFLDYMSLESQEAPALDLGPVDVRRIVEHASDVFQGHTPIDVEVAPSTKAARADVSRTKQIVLELVNNAIRFGNKKPITVRVSSDADEVRVAVTDEGRGIDPEHLDRIWDRAFRGRDSTGTGLGLYVSKVFAEAQGGRIEVRSEPGQGSTFTLVLPADV